MAAPSASHMQPARWHPSPAAHPVAKRPSLHRGAHHRPSASDDSQADIHVKDSVISRVCVSCLCEMHLAKGADEGDFMNGRCSMTCSPAAARAAEGSGISLGPSSPPNLLNIFFFGKSLSGSLLSERYDRRALSHIMAHMQSSTTLSRVFKVVYTSLHK